jgi:hypothetical protein
VFLSKMCFRVATFVCSHSSTGDQELNRPAAHAHRRCRTWLIVPQSCRGNRNTSQRHQIWVRPGPLKLPCISWMTKCSRSDARADAAVSKSIEAQSRLRVFMNDFPVRSRHVQMSSAALPRNRFSVLRLNASGLVPTPCRMRS